jgi:uncharacterized protein YdeI (YjbR/CyaY-like superfamily)
MPRSKSAAAQGFFASARAFRAWLARHSDDTPELIVGFYKVGSGKPSLTWPESVDEALCVGWIDGVRKRINDDAYQIRFSPRNEKSIWSSINIKRAEALIAEGRMKPAGLKAYQCRTERKSSVYSYEQTGSRGLRPGEIAAFRRNKAAWVYLEKAPPSYRRTLTHWVTSAKREATRARRLTRFIESCGAGVRFLP